MNAKNITWPQGRYNPGGVSKVWYAFREDIESFPTLADPETATTFESLVEYTEAIVMKTGKQFHELYCTLETGEVRSSKVGERDGKGYENFVEITFPGNEAEFLGFEAAALNREMVLIVQEKNKKIRVLGSLDDPATVEPGESTSGKVVSDLRSSVLTMKATGATPPPIYTVDMASILTPAV